MGVLKRHGFSPVTVFGIGVGYGTFPLYRAFPDAFYHLVDPARESPSYMQRLARRLRCELHPVALGDHEGTATLEVRADIQESTLLEEIGPRRVRRHDCVPLRRFAKPCSVRNPNDGTDLGSALHRGDCAGLDDERIDFAEPTGHARQHHQLGALHVDLAA